MHCCWSAILARNCTGQARVKVFIVYYSNLSRLAEYLVLLYQLTAAIIRIVQTRGI